LARQALSADPEAAAQLKRYEAAVVRLEKAKAAEKELEVIMKVGTESRYVMVLSFGRTFQIGCMTAGGHDDCE
jgi:hypothetical protein